MIYLPDSFKRVTPIYGTPSRAHDHFHYKLKDLREMPNLMEKLFLFVLVSSFLILSIFTGQS